eukprot:1145171-Pelagomonas_calceolata.AAC.2
MEVHLGPGSVLGYGEGGYLVGRPEALVSRRDTRYLMCVWNRLNLCIADLLGTQNLHFTLEYLVLLFPGSLE